MRALLGYDARMLRWSAVLALSLMAGLVASASAQATGIVQSFGFGGHTQPNAPHAGGPNYGVPGSPRPGRTSPYAYPYYPIYYPYYSVIDPGVYGGPVDGGPAGDSDEYMGGPTVFDRRGNGEYYRPQAPAPAAPPAHFDVADATAPTPDAPPEPAQPDTVLIFKDGHKLEINNYAIVGSNLFDLSNGRRQKIAISDLDVAATEKANEDQGVDFRLPTPPSGS